MIGRLVHRVGAEPRAVLEVEYRERTLFNRPANNLFVVAEGQPGHLQFQVELIRPEPRRGVIGFVLARDRRPCRARLIGRVLNRFQPDAVPGEAAMEPGDIADRQHVGLAGMHVFVDPDPVFTGNPGLLGDFLVRNDPDAGNDEVRRNGLAAAQHDAGDGAISAGHGLDPGRQPDINALCAMVFGEIGADRRPHPARHQAVGHFHDGHGLAHRAQGRRALQADEPAADDDHVPDLLKPFHDRTDIGKGADIVHAGQIRARHRQDAYPRAGRDHEFLVAEYRTVGAGHRLLLIVDGGRRHAQPQVDSLIGIEGFRPEQQPVLGDLAHQIGLGQRRALIRQFGFLAQHDDRFVVAGGTGGNRNLMAGMRPADHDQSWRGVLRHQICVSGMFTIRPSRASDISIWQLSRLFACRSLAVSSSISSSITWTLGSLSSQASST